MDFLGFVKRVFFFLTARGISFVRQIAVAKSEIESSKNENLSRDSALHTTGYVSQIVSSSRLGLSWGSSNSLNLRTAVGSDFRSEIYSLWHIQVQNYTIPSKISAQFSNNDIQTSFIKNYLGGILKECVYARPSS